MQEEKTKNVNILTVASKIKALRKEKNLSRRSGRLADRYTAPRE